MERSDAEEVRDVIQAHEPGVVVELSKLWFSRQWRVFVIRDGQRHECLGVYHYWLERALVETFCRPLDE